MTEDTLIDRLMDAHDLDREAAAAVVDDVQSDADVALVCSSCGEAEDDGARAVLAAVDPRDGERRALCDSCYAEAVEDHTILAPQQARILALMLADWTVTDIADAIGADRGNVSTQKGKIKTKREDALEQIDTAQRTLAVLEELPDER